MNFYAEFCRALFVQPIRALIALYWFVTRRRVRGRNQIRKITSQSRYAYLIWTRVVENLDQELAAAPNEMAGWTDAAHISIFLYVRPEDDVSAIRQTIASILVQCYEAWELLILLTPGVATPADISDPRIRVIVERAVSDVDALERVLGVAQGQYLLPISAGTRLSAAAIFLFVRCLQQFPEASIIYGDQDEMGEFQRRSNPWFKPRWNSELFLAQDYISHACIIRLDVARAARRFAEEASGAAIYALALSISERENAEIVHLAKVIAHLPEHAGHDDQKARVAVVAQYAGALAGAASAGPFGSVKVSWPLPGNPPKVSIIIPTKDKVTLLKNCVDSLIKYTDYPNYEVLIVDNGSVEKETKRYFDEISKRDNFEIVNFPGEFNFSAINNHAVTLCSGDYLCLLNNDTEILKPDWLAELMRYAIRDRVGAAGAKLLYPDSSIQHAGVVIGLGGAAGHAHRDLRDGDPGYFCRAHVTHFVSAVTAACFVVAKAKFEAVGGLDEKGFKVAFNDVDFCLKLERAGWRNVYVPHAVLIHHESKSRGNDHSRENYARYLRELHLLQARWSTVSYRDPLHHPHLDPASETYLISMKGDVG